MQDIVSHKYCPGCQKVKSTSEFHKDRTGKDGFYSICKSCKSPDGRKWRKNQLKSSQEIEATRFALGVKMCRKCEKEKPLDEFTLNQRQADGHDKMCKVCRNEIYRTKYHPRSAHVARERYLKHAFGLTTTEYETMHEAQGGVCACCGNPETFFDERTGRPMRLAVDHCHETGKIRELLCRACNQSLGLLLEDPERIKALLDYAERWKS